MALHAQNLATVSGVVYDKQTSTPLGYANIIMKSELENEMIAGTISRENGLFTLSGIPRGKYIVTCTYIEFLLDILHKNNKGLH